MLIHFLLQQCPGALLAQKRELFKVRSTRLEQAALQLMFFDPGTHEIRDVPPWYRLDQLVEENHKSLITVIIQLGFMHNENMPYGPASPA